MINNQGIRFSKIIEPTFYSMAIIYGYPDTEKRLLDKLPNQIKSIDDISQVHKDMKDDIDDLPNWLNFENNDSGYA